jgi:hypothetical protein
MSSLAAEPGEPGFVVSVFEVSSKDCMEDGTPSPDFLEREEEFDIVSVPYYALNTPDKIEHGLLCTRSADETYFARWGPDRFRDHFVKYGIDTIWNWSTTSGLLPCSIYLRHCYLAAQSMGEVCFDSFLDETFLVDRKTTIREYLKEHPEVLEARPPPDLESRYCG